MKQSDEYYMREALKEARKARKIGEVPVGAVAVHGGKIIGRGHNSSIIDSDPTAHAEVTAVRKAAKKLGNYRLNGCSVYATIEPCAMCAGMLVWARVSGIIYGAPDAKAGACGSVMDIPRNKSFNHRVKVSGGVLEKQCSSLIKDFFRQRRNKL
jgi:tRNA(adenine34) deaminase